MISIMYSIETVEDLAAVTSTEKEHLRDQVDFDDFSFGLVTVKPLHDERIFKETGDLDCNEKFHHLGLINTLNLRNAKIFPITCDNGASYYVYGCYD